MAFPKSTTARVQPDPGLTKLLIFETHPIQYRAPVFQSLAQHHPQLKVYFFDESFNANRWWFHEVGKNSFPDWQANYREGYESETLGLARLSPWRRLRKLAKVIRTEKPSHLLIYGYYLPEHWMLFALAKRYSLKIIFVGETFSEGHSPLRRLAKKILLKAFFKGVDTFIAIGSKTSDHYQRLGIPLSKIVQAKYCVDTNLFESSVAETIPIRKAIRTSLGIGEEAFVLLYVGRLFERKRPLDLVEIHRRLLAKHPIHTIVVGTGDLSNDLRHRAQSLEHFHMVGFKDQAELKKYYYASDIIVIPSQYETWGLVINEAFSCGLPAIVTNQCGAAHDLVQHETTGMVYPVGDTERAAWYVRELIENPLLRRTMGKAAQRLVTTEYRPDTFAEKILGILRQDSPLVSAMPKDTQPPQKSFKTATQNSKAVSDAPAKTD